MALRQQVLHAYTRSISTIWILGAPLLFLGAVCAVGMKHYSLDRRAVKAGEAETSSESSEATATDAVPVGKKEEDLEMK